MGVVGLEAYRLSLEWRIEGTGGRLSEGGLLSAKCETERGRGGGLNDPDVGRAIGLDGLLGGVRGRGLDGGGSVGIGSGEVGAGKASKSRMIGWDRIRMFLDPALGTGALTFMFTWLLEAAVGDVAVTMIKRDLCGRQRGQVKGIREM